MFSYMEDKVYTMQKRVTEKLQFFICIVLKSQVTTTISFIVLSDYCYTLDLETYQWNQQIISAPADVELVRSQHSGFKLKNKHLVRC